MGHFFLHNVCVFVMLSSVFIFFLLKVFCNSTFITSSFMMNTYFPPYHLRKIVLIIFEVGKRLHLRLYISVFIPNMFSGQVIVNLLLTENMSNTIITVPKANYVTAIISCTHDMLSVKYHLLYLLPVWKHHLRTVSSAYKKKALLTKIYYAYMQNTC